MRTTDGLAVSLVIRVENVPPLGINEEPPAPELPGALPVLPPEAAAAPPPPPVL